MNTLPRVSAILKTVGPQLDNNYLRARHLRRGRLVEAALTLVAQGQEINPEWWTQSSGDANDPDDYVPHEECRPYIKGGRLFLQEHNLKLLSSQLEVVHPTLRYRGHLDWLVEKETQMFPVIFDLKNGDPPAPNSPYDFYCRYQLQLYRSAYLAQYRKLAGLANLYLPGDGDYRIVWRDSNDREDAELLVRYYHLAQRWNGGQHGNEQESSGS